jgi:hypothetical protein
MFHQETNIPTATSYISDAEIVTALQRADIIAIAPDAVKTISKQLKHEIDPKVAFDIIVNGLAKIIADSGNDITVINRKHVEDVLTEGTKNEDDSLKEAISIVSSFKLPRYSYNSARKAYHWYVCMNVFYFIYIKNNSYSLF